MTVYLKSREILPDKVTKFLRLYNNFWCKKSKLLFTTSQKPAYEFKLLIVNHLRSKTCIFKVRTGKLRSNRSGNVWCSVIPGYQLKLSICIYFYTPTYRIHICLSLFNRKISQTHILIVADYKMLFFFSLHFSKKCFCCDISTTFVLILNG